MRKCNEKVQNSKSKPKKFSFLCTFKVSLHKPATPYGKYKFDVNYIFFSFLYFLCPVMVLLQSRKAIYSEDPERLYY